MGLTLNRFFVNLCHNSSSTSVKMWVNISFIDYEKQVVQVTVFEQHRTTSTNSYTEAREPKNNGELHLQRPQEELEFWSDRYRP